MPTAGRNGEPGGFSVPVLGDRAVGSGLHATIGNHLPVVDDRDLPIGYRTYCFGDEPHGAVAKQHVHAPRMKRVGLHPVVTIHGAGDQVALGISRRRTGIERAVGGIGVINEGLKTGPRTPRSQVRDAVARAAIGHGLALPALELVGPTGRFRDEQGIGKSVLDFAQRPSAGVRTLANPVWPGQLSNMA